MGVNIFVFIFFCAYHMDFLWQQLEEFVVGIDLEFLVRPLIVCTFALPMREVVLFDLLLDYFLHLKTAVEARFFILFRYFYFLSFRHSSE